MQSIDEVINGLICTIKSFQDPRRKELLKDYLTSMQVIGITAADEKIIVKGLLSTTKNWPPHKKIELSVKLVGCHIFECQHIAYVFLHEDKEALSMITPEDLIDLNKNLDNWASVDTYGVYIYGIAWRNGIVSNKEIKKLLESPDHWQRRIAVVSTIPLNQKSQGGTGDAKRTLEICKLVIGDHHDMVVKALSWALRELSKRDKKVVEEFLITYQNRLHKRVVREVSHKLVHGTKN